MAVTVSCIFIPTSHDLKSILRGARPAFVTIALFYDKPCLKRHCIKQERGPMSSEVNSLVQSHTASTHSADFVCSLHRCQELFWAWRRQQGTRTVAELCCPSPFAVRRGHVRRSPPGKVRLCYLLEHIEPSLFSFPRQEREHGQNPEHPGPLPDLAFFP